MKKTYMSPNLYAEKVEAMTALFGGSKSAGNPTGNPGDTPPTGGPEAPARKLYV